MISVDRGLRLIAKRSVCLWLRRVSLKLHATEVSVLTVVESDALQLKGVRVGL